MRCFQRICAIFLVTVLTSCGGGTATDTSTPVAPTTAPASATQAATTPTPEPPTVTASITTTTAATTEAGSGGSTAPQATAVSVATPTATASATPTATALPATSPTGWRYRDPNVAGQLFHFAGVRCGTPADLSGEWVISDTQIVEGVPIVGQYVISVDANQRTGSWVYEQTFETADVKSVGGFAGSVTQVALSADGSVVFSLGVGTPIEGKLYTPDGIFAWGDVLPVKTIDGMTWEPIYGACP